MATPHSAMVVHPFTLQIGVAAKNGGPPHRCAAPVPHVCAKVTVHNTADVDGDEVVQLYLESSGNTKGVGVFILIPIGSPHVL